MERLNELALFAGAGLGILGGRLLGWRTRCAVEIDPIRRRMLFERQRDGMLERFPIWDDIRTFDGNPWRGAIDVISGGFPCQDISCLGTLEGLLGEKSSLWHHMARIIREVRPVYVLVENVRNLTRQGLGAVLGDLAALGYDARWHCLGANDIGANHKRDRIWILAYSNRARGCKTNDIKERELVVQRWRDSIRCSLDVSDADKLRLSSMQPKRAQGSINFNVQWWVTEPRLGRVADGVPNRVDRIKAIGNGQVPSVVAAAWHLLGGIH
jgi:DNA (cytosine-5)-methyltransferase 1